MPRFHPYKSWETVTFTGTNTGTVPPAESGGNPRLLQYIGFFEEMASPERFELPTRCLGRSRSIQLSYGDNRLGS